MPDDGPPNATNRITIEEQPNTEQFAALAARAWGRRAASRRLGRSRPATSVWDPGVGYMTDFGMYERQTDGMWNIELGRIIQEDREREIQADIRLRRLIHRNEPGDVERVLASRSRKVQRPASTGAPSR